MGHQPDLPSKSSDIFCKNAEKYIHLYVIQIILSPNRVTVFFSGPRANFFLVQDV